MSSCSSSLHSYSKDEAGHVSVEMDPLMEEQMHDQEMRVPLIRVLRKELNSFFEANKDQELVQDLLSNDRTCYRFLKARKFVREHTVTMIKDAVDLRKEYKLDGILERPIPKALQWKTQSKHGWHYWDKFGRPIFIKNVGLQDFPALSGVGTVAERVHYSLFYNEYFRKVLIPEANARIGNKHVIDQICTIVNMQDFGMHAVKKFNYDWVREIARINSLIYPENMGHCFLINCPRVFSMVWAVVRPWLDERTRSKIHIYHDDGKEAMKQILNIDELPATIGGKCTCEVEGGCIFGAQSTGFVAHINKINAAASAVQPDDDDAVFAPVFHDAEEEERDLEQISKAFEEGAVITPTPEDADFKQ